jgi:hypothetical protein
VKVRESFELGRTYYGSPRILEDIQADGEHVSRKPVIRREAVLVARGGHVLQRREALLTSSARSNEDESLVSGSSGRLCDQ